MKAYEIWMEGYAATQDNDIAQYVGSIEAKSFREACIKFSKTEKAIENQWEEFFDPTDLSFWGCRLYDNEADARKTFG